MPHLPDVNFSTACTEWTNARVGVAGRGLPALDVGLSTDELEITGTLGVTVSSTVLGTSRVARVRGNTTVFLHSDEVQSRVETTLNGGQVDIEGELVAEEVEHLVLVLAIHEVEPRADVLAVLVLGDKAESEGVAACAGAVRLLVVGTLKCAALGALIGGCADAGPLVALVAALAPLDGVRPSPVGVDDDLGVCVCAGPGGAVLPGEARVGLGVKGASLLGLNRDCEEGDDDSF